MKTSVKLIISGIVQGVWYRASTKNMANKLAITGWIKNTSDGKVEAVFEGEEKQVEEMIKWCKKGPRFAKVENVVVKNQDLIYGFNNFTIKY